MIVGVGLKGWRHPLFLRAMCEELGQVYEDQELEEVLKEIGYTVCNWPVSKATRDLPAGCRHQHKLSVRQPA